MALDAHIEKQHILQSPVSADEPNFLAGANVYKQHCAACHGLPDPRTTMGYTHVIGDDHRKVAEQLGGFFAQVRLNLPKYKNGSGDGSSQADEV